MGKNNENETPGGHKSFSFFCLESTVNELFFGAEKSNTLIGKKRRLRESDAVSYLQTDPRIMEIHWRRNRR